MQKYLSRLRMGNGIAGKVWSSQKLIMINMISEKNKLCLNTICVPYVYDLWNIWSQIEFI